MALRIVIFIDWFAPAYKAGGPIQSIVNLVNQPWGEVEYRIVCSNHDLDGQTLTGVNFNEWVHFNVRTAVWYASDKKNVFELLKQLSHWQPDVYFINGLYSPWFNFLPAVLGRAGKKIISARGMLHSGALSQKGLKKQIYLRLWRLLNLHRKHSYHATNDEESEFIRAAFGNRTKIYVAANLPRSLVTNSVHPKQKNALELISIGLVSPMKNYLEVLKSLSLCDNKINYTIYGAVKDPAYWQECLRQIEALPDCVRVHYAGDIPSSRIGEALSKAHVFVLPSKSENFGHAIYEALTAGLPVITSHATPWNGLEENRAGFNVSPENHYELSKAICFFAAAGEEELTHWWTGARAYAKNAINVAAIKGQYLRMFQS